MTEKESDILDIEKKISLEKQYRLQWEEAQDCFVLLYPEGMVKLPGSSGEIMSLVTGELSMADIINNLENKFPDTDLKDDVVVFLNKCYSNGWIREE